MSQYPTERVLVVPTELFHRLGYFQGFCRDVERYLGQLLSSENMSFRPRGEVEKDPSFKQLIPYMLFRHRSPSGPDTVFQYTRGTGMGRGDCTENEASASAATSPRIDIGAAHRRIPIRRGCGGSWRKR